MTRGLPHVGEMEETCLLGQSWGGSTVATPTMSLPLFSYKYRGREQKKRERREGKWERRGRIKRKEKKEEDEGEWSEDRKKKRREKTEGDEEEGAAPPATAVPPPRQQHRIDTTPGNLLLPCFVSSCSAPACICMQNVNNSCSTANGEGASYCVCAQ